MKEGEGEEEGGRGVYWMVFCEASCSSPVIAKRYSPTFSLHFFYFYFILFFLCRCCCCHKIHRKNTRRFVAKLLILGYRVYITFTRYNAVIPNPFTDIDIPFLATLEIRLPAQILIQQLSQLELRDMVSKFTP